MRERAEASTIEVPPEEISFGVRGRTRTPTLTEQDGATEGVEMGAGTEAGTIVEAETRAAEGDGTELPESLLSSDRARDKKSEYEGEEILIDNCLQILSPYSRNRPMTYTNLSSLILLSIASIFHLEGIGKGSKENGRWLWHLKNPR